MVKQQFLDFVENSTMFLGLTGGVLGILAFVSFLLMGLMFGGAIWVDPLAVNYSLFSILGLIGSQKVRNHNNIGSLCLIVSTCGMYLSLRMAIVPIIFMSLSGVGSICMLLLKKINKNHI